MIPKQHISFSEEELNTFLKTAGIVCISVLALFLLVKTINEVKTYSTIGDVGISDVQNTIVVTGKSDIDVKPDVTIFSWSTDALGKTTEDSQSKVATISNRAMEFLKENGVNESDLKSSGLITNTHYINKVVSCEVTTKAPTRGKTPESNVSVMPIIVQPCGGSESVPSGFETSQTVTVKVRDINSDPEKTGRLVAGLGSIGVKVGAVENIVDNSDVYENQVRGEAIAKARSKAQTLASQLGVKLGKVVSFNENMYPYPVAYGGMARSAMMDEKAVVPDLPTGTNKVSSEVTITYQIK